MLDLRDLGHLLEDDKFKGNVSKQFFAGDLSRFHFTRTAPTRARMEILDRRKIIFAIGDEITQQSPLIQALSEPFESDILSTALLVWPPRLANLQRLEVFDGKVIADETVRNLLHAHCPNLDTIGVYRSQASEGDHALGSLISGMPENKLVKLESHGDCGIAAETCLALNNHGQSLREISLFLNQEGMLALGLLQGCTALDRIVIATDPSAVDLKATENDVYLEVVEWLKSCTGLRHLEFQNVLSAPDLILPVLEEGKIALEALTINAKYDSRYLVKDHHDFHRALSRQTGLQKLRLQADPDPASRDDVETLMNTFCSLSNLNELTITSISDYFSDGQINMLTQHLPKLQELYIAGYGITDAVWSDMAKLKDLKNVTFSGVTAFTSGGIVNFVEQLGPGNAGLSLSVDMADPDSALTQEEQDLLRELFQVQFDGRFEYQLLRGMLILHIYVGRRRQVQVCSLHNIC